MTTPSGGDILKDNAIPSTQEYTLCTQKHKNEHSDCHQNLTPQGTNHVTKAFDISL